MEIWLSIKEDDELKEEDDELKELRPPTVEQLSTHRYIDATKIQKNLTSARVNLVLKTLFSLSCPFILKTRSLKGEMNAKIQFQGCHRNCMTWFTSSDVASKPFMRIGKCKYA